ncbi:MAG: hypothetical protein AAFU41_12520 [Pseudomonadota bacterium]
MRLSAVSPLTADPADLAIALTLPDGVAVTADTARLTMTLMRQGQAEVEGDSFVLAAEGDVYRIDPGDLAAIRALQARGRQWKADFPGEVNGALSITLAPCTLGGGPAEDATVDVAIRLEADGPFRPLINGAPLSAIADQETLTKLPYCYNQLP